MDKEKQRRIAERFLSDDAPCAPANNGKIHEDSKGYEVVQVDKATFYKHLGLEDD